MPSECVHFADKSCLLFIFSADLQSHWIISTLKTQAEWVAKSSPKLRFFFCVCQHFTFLQRHIYIYIYMDRFFIVFLWTSRWKFRDISFSFLKIFNTLSSHLKPLVFPGADESVRTKMTYLLLHRKKMKRENSITQLKFKRWIPWGKD